MSDALRELLASFTVEVDRAGELAKGNAAIDALHARLKQITEQARPATKAVRDIFGQAAASASAFTGAGAAGANFGSARPDSTGFAGLGALKQAQDLKQAEAAAVAYSQTLRGRLGTALGHVREGFTSPSTGVLSGMNAFRLGVAGFAGGIVARGIAGAVNGVADIADGAARLGVTTDDFQRLDVMAKQAGASVDTLGTAFRTLANGAVQPTTETTAAFAKLGVTTKDAAGGFKGTQELFFEVAEALADVTDETQRSAIAQDLLGRSAQQLKPLFAGGSEAVRKQRSELLAMSVISNETIMQADALTDSWVSLKANLFQLATNVLAPILLPILKGLTDLLRGAVNTFRDWTKGVQFGRVALVGLGLYLSRFVPMLRLLVGLGGGFGPMMLRWAGAAGKAALSFARMALPLLAIEDFIGFLQGNDSALGRGLDGLLGEGGGEKIRLALVDMAAAAKDVIYWLAGGDLGPNAKNLYRDLSEFLNLIVNDLLKLIGIGKGGLNGPVQGDNFGDLLVEGASAFSPALGGVARALQGSATSSPTAEVQLAASSVYGPPTASGSVAGNAPVFGDNIITINGVQPGEARAAADRIGLELERSLESALAGVP